MSAEAIANLVIVTGCVLAIGIIAAIHIRHRLQGRKPGQRWNECRKQWEDW